MRWVAGLLLVIAAATACSDEAPAPVPAPRYITSFGTWGNDDGEFEYPQLIAIGPDSFLYVGDNGNGRIQVFTSDGSYVRQWPASRYTSMIVVAPDGAVYLTSREPGSSGPLMQYTAAGEFQGTWDFVNSVRGLEVDNSGNLYVYGTRIIDPSPLHTLIEGPYYWKFNSRRELIKKWGYPGPRDTTGWAGGPMTWNTEGNLLVLGSLDSTAAVFEFTPEGTAVSVWPIPTPERQFLEDIAVDRQGRIHITGTWEGFMYMFDPQGWPLAQWNEVSESEEPLGRPSGVAVDAAGFLYVVDWLRYRVVKYDPGP